MNSPRFYNVKISEKALLYSYYMPFFVGGGLFLPTRSTIPMGTHLSLLVKLLDDVEPTPVEGVVAWLTPPVADTKKLQGVGVRFTWDQADLKGRIEGLLGEMLDSGKVTATF